MKTTGFAIFILVSAIFLVAVTGFGVAEWNATIREINAKTSNMSLTIAQALLWLNVIALVLAIVMIFVAIYFIWKGQAHHPSEGVTVHHQKPGHTTIVAKETSVTSMTPTVIVPTVSAVPVYSPLAL